MQYTIDAERGILLQIEDDEADRVARIIEQRRLVAVEPEMQPISLTDAVAKCHEISARIEAMDAQISAQQHAALDDCECSRIGVPHCGMCEGEDHASLPK